MQMLPFSIFGQSVKNDRAREVMVDEVFQEGLENQIDLVQQNKIAPDLELRIDDLSKGFRADESQPVIIQLKNATEINNSHGDEFSQDVKEQMIAEEVQANKSRALTVKSKLRGMNGRYKKSFAHLGLVTADLPLSKVRELIEDEDVAYISPDRETEATGHIETTTGASLVRSLVTGTTIGGNGIGIAILDSGVEGNHADFKPIITSRVVYHKSFITGNTDTSDKYGHGTHVAGLAAGTDIFSNNNSGYYNGTAPSANVLNLKVLDDTGRGTVSNVIAAIDWAIANKAAYNIRVMNMSLGTGAKDSYTTDPLCLAARRAFNAGIVVVASAGNNGKDAAGNKVYGGIGSPGIEPSVITVGAVNTYGTDIRSDDTIATFSSRGPTRGYTTVSGVRKYDNRIKPDLVAPGNKLIAAAAVGTGTADPLTGWIYYKNKLVTDYPSIQVTQYVDSGAGVNRKGYQYLSGTSMAAPTVSGAVALMLQIRPNLTPSLVKAILMYSAQPINGANTFEQGAGNLNADGAARLAKLVKTTLPTTNGSAMLSATLPASQTSVIAGETVYWGKGVITNYGFLYGNDLMTKFQGMYKNGVLVGDGTPFSGTVIARSTTLTSGTLSLYQGAIKNNGVLVGDGTLFLSSNAMAATFAPYVNGQGVLVGDGVLIGDGVLVGDGVLIGDGNATALATWLGDNTASMLPAP